MKEGEWKTAGKQSSRSKFAVLANDWQPRVICSWTFLFPRHLLRTDFPVLEEEREILSRAAGLLTGLDYLERENAPLSADGLVPFSVFRPVV